MIPVSTRPKGATLPFARWLFILMFAGLGLGGGFSIWHGLKTRQSHRWPTAEGLVALGWVKTTETRSKNRQGISTRRETHEVMVDYSFTAEGQTLTASGAAPRQIEDDEGETAAQALADSFVPGSKIPVFYQAGNPKDNRLRRVEISSTTWLWWVIGGGWAVLGGLAGLFRVA